MKENWRLQKAVRWRKAQGKRAVGLVGAGLEQQNQRDSKNLIWGQREWGEDSLEAAFGDYERLRWKLRCCLVRWVHLPIWKFWKWLQQGLKWFKIIFHLLYNCIFQWNSKLKQEHRLVLDLCRFHMVETMQYND